MSLFSFFTNLFGGNNQSSPTPVATPTPSPTPTLTPVSVPVKPTVTVSPIVPVPSTAPVRAGLPIIKEFEGCKLVAYQDIVGVWTIGYGETLNVHQGMVITQAQADQMVETRYDWFESKVQALLKVEVTENELGALTSFAYNLGVGSLANSTLLRLLNADTPHSVVAEQFAQWNKAGGQPVAGLTRRRAAEAALFLQE